MGERVSELRKGSLTDAIKAWPTTKDRPGGGGAGRKCRIDDWLALKSGIESR